MLLLVLIFAGIFEPVNAKTVSISKYISGTNKTQNLSKQTKG